ncbi:MAG: hypothetical protein COB88_02090 [Flavobacteriales bacterium]|nr:MAG: hypothetical protein COB88_02090 [Flavobacteriales bacterium]
MVEGDLAIIERPALCEVMIKNNIVLERLKGGESVEKSCRKEDHLRSEQAPDKNQVFIPR